MPAPQAYEAQAQVTELSEEMELLRLKLDIAEQEKCEAQQRVAGAFGWWWGDRGRSVRLSSGWRVRLLRMLPL